MPIHSQIEEGLNTLIWKENIKFLQGLPLLEYNRALYQGRISPARDDEITNPDESHSEDQSLVNLTRTLHRRRSAGGYLDMSDSGYSGSGRRRLHHQFEQCEEPVTRGKTAAGKAVYPPMQVVNIEMATGQKKSLTTGSSENHGSTPSHCQSRISQKDQVTSVIDQADYEASMAGGKIFGKPVGGKSISVDILDHFQENIRTYGAMIRANEDHVERNQTGTTKKDRSKPLTKGVISWIIRFSFVIFFSRIFH